MQNAPLTFYVSITGTSLEHHWNITGTAHPMTLVFPTAESNEGCVLTHITTVQQIRPP
jgi:hypothetical protein